MNSYLNEKDMALKYVDQNEEFDFKNMQNSLKAEDRLVDMVNLIKK